MKDQMLLQVTEVTDDSTGIWHVGGIEFDISASLDTYLAEYGEEGRDKILDALEYLKWAVARALIIKSENMHAEEENESIISRVDTKPT